MKTTKKYLKTLTMCVVMITYIISLAIAIFLGTTGLFGIFVSEDLIISLLFILVAVILGFVVSILSDLIEWLDKKFRPY